MQHVASEEQAAKLTSWKNEPSLMALKHDLELAKQPHDSQVAKLERWNNLLQVSGEAKPPKRKGRSSVQPKLIRRQAEWRYSALTEPFLGSHKVFKVKPQTFEDGPASKQAELVLNHQFKTKLNRVKFIDDYVRSTVDEGTCVVQVGWCRQTVMVKEKAPVWGYYQIQTQEELQALQQAAELKLADPRSYDEQVPPELKAAVDYFEETGQGVTAIPEGEEEIQVEKILKNHPTVEIRDPRNVYIDPTCGGDIDKANFIALTFETSHAELKKYPKRYKNLEHVNWEGSAPVTTPDHETKTPDTFNFQDKARKKVVAYEYWGFYDIHGNGSLESFVATWIGNTLVRMELNPMPDGKLPFVLVQYLPVKRDVYGEPDAELLEDNQKILGAVTRGMIDLLGRSANGQQGFAKGMLDTLNRRRFENGQDYEFNPNVPPQAGHIEHKYPEFPQSALAMLQLQNQEAEALTGVKSFSGGMSGEAYGDVAAGIRGVLDAASKREMAILRRLAMGMKQIGDKINAMNQEFMSDIEVVRITNSEFVEVKREDIQGNFDLDVDISTAEVDQAQAQDLVFMLQTMGNNLDLGLTIMILAEIAELKRMPELANKIKNFQPKPDPIVEEMKKLELEKLRMEVEELRTKAQLNEAKAAQAEADADRTNLDFVEQETGTAHEREMEKQRAQSQGNQNLQITKALTTPLKKDQKKPDIEAAVGWNELTKDNPGIRGNSGGQPVDIPAQVPELAPVDPTFGGDPLNPELV